MRETLKIAFCEDDLQIQVVKINRKDLEKETNLKQYRKELTSIIRTFLKCNVTPAKNIVDQLFEAMIENSEVINTQKEIMIYVNATKDRNKLTRILNYTKEQRSLRNEEIPQDLAHGR